jgi:hypothetical protein
MPKDKDTTSGPPEYGYALTCAEREIERLRDALLKQHLALTALGCRIQNDRGAWKVRTPHEDMPAIVQQVNEAMAAFHATRAHEPAAPTTSPDGQPDAWLLIDPDGEPCATLRDEPEQGAGYTVVPLYRRHLPDPPRQSSAT